MLTETPELDRLRKYACETDNADDFRICYYKYRRKGGKHDLVFYPKRKVKATYSKVFRVEKNGEKKYTFYRNQLSKEFIADCLMLRAEGMRFEDIALCLSKNYGITKDNSVKYACTLK